MNSSMFSTPRPWIPLVIILSALGCLFAGCGGTDEVPTNPTILTTLGEPPSSSSEKAMNTEELWSLLTAIRVNMGNGDYDEAISQIDHVLGTDPKEALRHTLVQMRVACFRSRFLENNPFELDVQGPPKRSPWDNELSLSFCIYNRGVDPLLIQASDSSFLGLGNDRESMLVLTVTDRSVGPHGVAMSSLPQVVTLEDDIEIPPGGFHRIRFRLQLPEAKNSVFRQVDVGAVLQPLTIGPRGGQPFYLPLTFPDTRYEMYVADQLEGLDRPLVALEEALSTGEEERLVCAMMALGRDELVQGFDRVLDAGVALSASMRHAIIATLSARTGQRHSLDLETWRGWWNTYGRDRHLRPALGDGHE